MDQAIKNEIKEIRRMKKACNTTTSVYLKRDYSKSIKKRTKELKKYCEYRNIDFNTLGGQYGLF